MNSDDDTGIVELGDANNLHWIAFLPPYSLPGNNTKSFEDPKLTGKFFAPAILSIKETEIAVEEY